MYVGLISMIDSSIRVRGAGNCFRHSLALSVHSCVLASVPFSWAPGKTACDFVNTLSQQSSEREALYILFSVRGYGYVFPLLRFAFTFQE